MDYTELLFAAKVRDLVIEQIQKDAKKANQDYDEFLETVDRKAYIATIVSEISDVTKLIRPLRCLPHFP